MYVYVVFHCLNVGLEWQSKRVELSTCSFRSVNSDPVSCAFYGRPVWHNYPQYLNAEHSWNCEWNALLRRASDKFVYLFCSHQLLERKMLLRFLSTSIIFLAKAQSRTDFHMMPTASWENVSTWFSSDISSVNSHTQRAYPLANKIGFSSSR